MVDIVGKIPHQMEENEISHETLIRRSRVLDAIAVLEKNKIPASNDHIFKQIEDAGLQRKEVLEIISQLYIGGYIKKSKGNFKVTKARKVKSPETGAESTTPPTPPMPPAAGVSIPHDGLPTISSVHSYQAGKTMTYPVGMVEENEKIRHVHPWQVPPRYIQPNANIIYHPGMRSRFVHPGQMIPIHVPRGQAIAESAGAPNNPHAYYQFMHNQHDGKPVQWVFYPISIPVNAVRPIISEKCSKSNNATPSKDNDDELSDPSSLIKLKSPENITSDMIENVPTIDSETLKSRVLNTVTEIHPRNLLKSSQKRQPCSDKLKYHNIAEDFNKASSLLRDQGPNRVASVASPKENSNVSNYSTIYTKNNLTDEINRLSAMHPREALLAKKRQQLLGIVDRVTEVAASKQNIEEQRKSIINEDICKVQSSGETSSVSSTKDGSDLIDTYIDEIEMESAKIRNRQNNEIEKSRTQQAFHPRFSLMAKPKSRLVDINRLPETEEQKEQRRKDFSSLDNIRNILRSPPDFMGKAPNDSSIVHDPTITNTAKINRTRNIDPPIFIHPRKVLYNSESPPNVRKTPPNFRKTPEPNAFEQKVISEMSNSIKSLHSMSANHRSSPVAPVNNKTDSDGIDENRNIFRELERNAILEAKELGSQQLQVNSLVKPSNNIRCTTMVSPGRVSTELNNIVEKYDTNESILNTKDPLTKSDEQCISASVNKVDVPNLGSASPECNNSTKIELDNASKYVEPTDSGSDEYHALKEISILQSANKPLVHSFRENVSGTLISTDKTILNGNHSESDQYCKQRIDEDNLHTKISCNFSKTDSTNNVERNLETTQHDAFEFCNNKDGGDDIDNDEDYDYDDDGEDDEDDDNDYTGDNVGESLFDPITFLSCSYKTLDIFNPNVIVDDVLKVEKYNHMLPPMETETEDEDDYEWETTHGSEPPVENQKENSNKNKLDVYLTEDSEEEVAKKKRNISKHKEIPLRTERIKRCKIGVFYKDTRTNFMKAPLSSPTLTKPHKIQVK